MATKRLQRGRPRERTNVPSVLSLVSDNLREVFSGAKKSKRKPTLHSRSFAPSAIHAYESEIARLGWTHEELVEDEEFFDVAVCTSPQVAPLLPAAPAVTRRQMRAAQAQKCSDTKGQRKWMLSTRKKREKVSQQVQRSVAPEQQAGRPPVRLEKEQEEEEEDTVLEDFVDFFDNSDRTQHGLGLVRRLFGGVEPSKDFKPKRPYFTFWVTCIQIVIFIVSVSVYGFAPIGVNKANIEGEIMTTKLVIEKVAYRENANMWIGPRKDDLIHLGAKFSPCMRKDVNVEKVLECDRGLEAGTACCVYNDGRGCLQQSEASCPYLASWNKWSLSNPGYQNRTSGSVCGQDPRFCKDPASTGAFKWTDNISQWPLCRESSNATGNSQNMHMTCEIVGRPCCVGIQGECIIATREYCDFRRGYFHDEAFLCSQVSCFEEVCGLFPFADPSIPDQFYRLIFSIFLHAGVFSLIITILFQMLIMRDLERISGWWRMTITYMGGGVAGSLASAIFLPYHVEAGPSGSQFAVIASLIVEIFRWNKDKKPYITIAKIIAMCILLFAVGLLPGVDNYAHLFGFGYGFFLSISFRPYKSVCRRAVPKAGQIACGVVAFMLSLVVFAILVVYFYVYPLYECTLCSYFNCIPFTADFCESMSVSIQRTENAQCSI